MHTLEDLNTTLPLKLETIKQSQLHTLLAQGKTMVLP